jgi:peptide/nickel transport system substrate-binding protein
MANRIKALCAIAWLLAVPAEAGSLRYGGTTPPLTMDPHATNDFVTAGLVRQVYDSVVSLADDMSIGPGLATSWTYRGDATWRFTIRRGVVFQDGSPMRADDVIFSILRQRTSPLYGALFGDIKSAVKIDDDTVDVISAVPDPILPRKMVRLFVMSEAWAKANGLEKIPDLGAQGTEAYSLRHALGTGPMRLEAQEPGRRTVFQRNRSYWGAFAGNVDEATYTPIGSGPTRVVSLLSGELDLITDLPNQDLDRVKGTAGFKVAQVPQQLFMELEMDGTREVALDVFDKTNWALWSNPEFDAVVDELVATFDPARRTELYRRGLSVGRDQVHAVYLHQPVLSWGMRDAVTAPARADGAVMLQEVTVR